MLYSGSHYRASVVIAHERKRNAGDRMGTTGTTLAIALIMRGARVDVRIVLLVGTSHMHGMLAGCGVRSGYGRIRQTLQHRRHAQCEGQ